MTKFKPRPGESKAKRKKKCWLQSVFQQYLLWGQPNVPTVMEYLNK